MELDSEKGIAESHCTGTIAPMPDPIAKQSPWDLLPSPEVTDHYWVELVDRYVPGYRRFAPGESHPDRSKYPNTLLADEKVVEGDDNMVRRFWSTDPTNQDAYNYGLTYSAESVAHPIWARRYLYRRDQYTALTTLTAFTGVFLIKVTDGGSGYVEPPEVTITGTGTGATAVCFVSAGVVKWARITAEGTGYTGTPTIAFVGGGGVDATATAIMQGTAKLVHQELQELPQDEPRRSLWVTVLCVWETLPGPEITGVEYDERGDLKTTTHQRVVAGTAPDADGLLVIASAVEGKDSVVSERIVETVPSYAALTHKEFERQRAMGQEVTIADDIVAPSTTLTDPTYTPTGGTLVTVQVLNDELKVTSVTKARRLKTSLKSGKYFPTLTETHIDEQTGICIDLYTTFVPAGYKGGIGHVASISLTSGGVSALAAGDYWLIASGACASAAIAAATVNSSHVVTSVKLLYGGGGYTTAPTFTLTGSSATFAAIRGNGYVEIQKFDKWLSISVTSVLRDGMLGGLANTVPVDTRYPVTQRETFPDVLKDVQLLTVSGTTTQGSWNKIEGYSGPVKGRLTRKYIRNDAYANWDTTPTGTIFTTRPEIVQFFPQENRVAVSINLLGVTQTVYTREFPMSLHEEVDLTVLGGAVTAILPATKPTDLPYQTWIVRSIREEQWRFDFWLVEVMEIFVPPDPQV